MLWFILWIIGFLAFTMIHFERTPGEPISNVIAAMFWPVSLVVGLVSRM